MKKNAAHELLLLATICPSLALARPLNAMLEMYPQTASVLTYRRIRADFSEGRTLLFGVYKSSGNLFGIGETIRSYSSAKIYLQSAASTGYAPAETLLGLMYEKGLGYNIDFAKAIFYFQKAALQNYAPAELRLGDMFAAGLGVPRSEQRAEALYKEAEVHSELGSVPYKTALARIEDIHHVSTQGSTSN